MFHRRYGLLLLQLVHIVTAAGEPEGYVHHPAPQLAECWGEPHATDTAVPPERKATIRFSVRQRNLDLLAQTARRVSDPKSPEYGQYLSGDQVARMTRPAPADTAAVTSWLHQAGANYSVTDGGAGVELTSTAGELSRLFLTRFRIVSNSCTGQRTVQAADYWLPAPVEAAVAAVYGFHGLPLPPRKPPIRRRHDVVSVTPSVLASTYNISAPKASSAKNSQAVAEFQGQTMRVSDLSQFFQEYLADLPASDGVVHKFVGSDPTGDGGIEASLDIQYIMGVAPGVKTEFWYWGDDDFCADLKEWSGAIVSAAKTGDAPLVHSVSYGWQGKLSEVGCEPPKVADVDANFVKLAAMGITIIFASGDSGSGYSGSLLPWRRGTLYPSWPASSPWVTAVGSTRFVKQMVGQPEMATDQFGSGGGFSAMFDAFKDQVSAVQGYLDKATGLPPARVFPAGGRATPDVSALGEGFQVIADGFEEDVGGTSASAPTFAGIVSLLNRARLEAGRPVMGYINPWLYQNPHVFTDVTVGTNKIDRNGETVRYGFDCAPGWDPVTGLGTPIFDKMVEAALEMPMPAATQIVV